MSVLEATKGEGTMMLDSVINPAGEQVRANGLSEREAATVPAGEPGRRSFWYGVRAVLANPLLVWGVLNAQIRLRRARPPRSVRLQGRAVVGGGGEIVFGERVRITGTRVPVEVVAWPGGRITVGDGTAINYGVSISAHESVSIGRDCLIGQYAIINDNDYHDLEDRSRVPPSKPVVLEDRVWLAARVIVLKGVRIGHDAAVSAGSVVTRDIPPRSIVAGNPARVIGKF